MNISKESKLHKGRAHVTNESKNDEHMERCKKKENEINKGKPSMPMILGGQRVYDI